MPVWMVQLTTTGPSSSSGLSSLGPISHSKSHKLDVTARNQADADENLSVHETVPVFNK
eukprot:CAMPEP_0197623700 /NCGR_PEP_ID=MMETSP1338-20131121/3658_2 /TAXON_ID=43686 ORGANISM="Pelagodinium beii, Strain RCC1491" /NCGR_SAMPLE_ID=MMETSP1338 /ASSEMBLY_ACC=CAM_ASM_000754 /LENGTH=58 /DNA_ID=CAMNT_0043193757 /DNA_START=432 /DNA_END=608 /DNA_ORIENTATION=-